MKKFFEQWNYRLELEQIKVRQFAELRIGDQQQRKRFTQEIKNFLANVEKRRLEENL